MRSEPFEHASKIVRPLRGFLSNLGAAHRIANQEDFESRSLAFVQGQAQAQGIL